MLFVQMFLENAFEKVLMCLPSFPFKDCILFSDRQLSRFNICLGLCVCVGIFCFSCSYLNIFEGHFYFIMFYE